MDARELLERYEAGERDFIGADLYYLNFSGADLSRIKSDKFVKS